MARGRKGAALAAAAMLLVSWSMRAADEPGFYFHRLSVEDGLPQATVLSGIQDRTGFIWLGTQDGLVRFDGFDMTLFQGGGVDDQLSDDFISALAQDNSGHIWIGTRGAGLNRLDPKTGRAERVTLAGEFGSALGILAIQAANENGVWVGTTSGLFRVDADTVHAFRANEGLSHDQVLSLAVDDGHIWVGTEQGLDRLDTVRREFHHLGISGSPLANAITALLVDGAQVWVGTREGLHVLDTTTEMVRSYRSNADEPASLSDDRISALIKEDAYLWVGTEAGLDRFDPRTGQFVNYRHDPVDPNSLGSGRVNTLFTDRNGQIWVGTYTGGVSRFRPRNSFVRWGAGMLGNRNARAVAAAPDGSVWVGSDSGLIQVRDDGTRASWPAASGALGPIRSVGLGGVAIPADGSVWVGGDGGLCRIDPENDAKRCLTSADGLTDARLEALVPSLNGGLWIGTYNGLNLFREGELQAFLFEPGAPDTLGNGRIYSILEESDGRLWVGTQRGGLLLREPGDEGFRSFTHRPGDPASLSDNGVVSIHRAASGGLWVATGRGLNQVIEKPDGLRFKSYTARDGFASDRFGKILEDARGRLWLSSIQGISRFDPKDGSIANFDYTHGALRAGYWVASGAKGEEGTMYFGGIGGLTVFDPESVAPDPFPPPVVITHLLIDDRRVVAGTEDSPIDVTAPFLKAFSLPYGEDFGFEFAALHYAAPEKNLFAYKLTPYHDDWVETDSSRRSASFTNLQPGHYEFRVKAANSDGVWNETGASIAVSIIPPWWMTWWARAAGLAALLALIVGLMQWRVRFLQSMRQTLRERVEERTADIAAISEIGQELTATLDMNEVLDKLYRSVNARMDAHTFGIDVYDPERDVLVSRLDIEGGKRLAPSELPMTDTSRPAVTCVREQREVIVLNEQDWIRAFGSYPTAVKGEPMMSVVYLPLKVQDRILGCLTVQSPRPNAYTQDQIEVVRTLASYTAIALENSDSYRGLQEAQQQLVIQEKMASLGTLTAGVAHEINNPTNFANVAAQNLKVALRDFESFLRDLAGGDEADTEVLAALDERFGQLFADVDTVAEGCQRIKNIVRDLRTFSRLDQAEKKFIDVRESLRATVNLVRTQYLDGIEFVEEYGEIPDVECYPAKLTQVFLNLLVNACQAVAARAAGEGPAFRGRVVVGVDYDGKWVIVSFEDNGVGMNDDLAQRAFEPFFTTKPVGEGTGMGLSISYGIVEEHGGRLEVESKEGEGSVFRVRLPR